MDISDLIAYLAVAAVTVGISLALLCITKIPTFVILGSSVIVAALYLAYLRLSTGHWDMFANLVFFWVAIYAFVVSFLLLGIGRFLRWRFFLGRDGKSSATSQG